MPGPWRGDGSDSQRAKSLRVAAHHTWSAAVDRRVYVQAGAFVAICAAAGAVIGAIVAWLKGA